jgi:hypothetical protein
MFQRTLSVCLIFALVISSISYSKPTFAGTYEGTADKIEICMSDVVAKRTLEQGMSKIKKGSKGQLLMVGLHAGTAVAVALAGSVVFGLVMFVSQGYPSLKNYLKYRKEYKAQVKDLTSNTVETLNKSLSEEFLMFMGKIVDLKFKRKSLLITKFTVKSEMDGKEVKFRLEKKTGVYKGSDFILNPRPDCSAPFWKPEWHPVSKKRLEKRREEMRRKAEKAAEKRKKMYDNDLG